MHARTTLFRALRVFTALVACAVAATALAACGSDDNGSRASTAAAASGSSTPSSSADSDYAAAQKVVDLAASSGVLGPGSGEVTPDELMAPRASAIDVVPYKPGSLKKTVTIVSCGPANSCGHPTELMVAVFKKLGLGVNVVTSKGYTAADFQAAWNTALGKKPNAIIGIATVGAAIGPQLAQAKKAGIFTVFLLGTTLSGKGFDAYVPAGWNMGHVANAAEMAVLGKGKAKIVYQLVPEFPDLGFEEAIGFLQKVCPGCQVVKKSSNATNVSQPVTMGQTTTGIIRSTPGLDFLTVANVDVAIPAAAAAVRASNQPNVKITAPSLTISGAQDVKTGDLPYVTGAPVEWYSLQAVDATLRGLLGKPAIAPEKRSITSLIMTKDDLPPGKLTPQAVDKWAKSKFDFVKPFSDAWGVDLSSVSG